MTSTTFRPILLALALATAWPAAPGRAAATAGRAPAPAAPKPAATSVSARPDSTRAAGTAQVTYVTGGAVYLDAGRLDGVREGDTLTVSRDGVTVARLRAAYTSSHRTACDTLACAAFPRPGDAVRFVPRVEPPAAGALTVPAPGGALVPPAAAAGLLPRPATSLIPNPPRSRGARLRGRIGARLLAIQSREAGDLTQPALDARFEAVNAGGLPFDLLADVRGRRTSRSAPGAGSETESATRVYRLAGSLHDRSAHHRLTFGRQASPMLASVSLFDGALGEWGGSRWSLGAFSGTQPDPVKLTFSQDVLQTGAFLETHQPQGSVRRWSVAAGGVTSEARGQVNRDFVFAQGSYHDPLVSLSFAQEADLLRGWKRDSAGTSFSLTSTFVTLNVRPAEGLSLTGGYDGRRNVRLYRDRETPETAFDDRFREGGWLGASVELGPHARVSGDARSMGGSLDRSNSWSASGEVMRLTRVNGRLRARWSRSDSPTLRAKLVSLGGGFDPFDGGHLELGGGMRSNSDVSTGTQDDARWVNSDLDVTFLRRLLLSVSWEHTSGDLEHVDQEYAGLSVRF
jgi:hypothetical protein